MQNWKKGCVFGHINKFWKGHNGQIKKNACINAYLWSIFMFRVCFESPFTKMISSLQYKCPQGYQAHPNIHVKRVFFHSWAVYVRNMNRVSNSCKIGLQGYDCLGRSYM